MHQMLCVNRYCPARADAEEMLQLTDIQELLGLQLLGVIPESKAVLTATNLGQPVISVKGEDPAGVRFLCAYSCLEYSYFTGLVFARSLRQSFLHSSLFVIWRALVKRLPCACHEKLPTHLICL